MCSDKSVCVGQCYFSGACSQRCAGIYLVDYFTEEFQAVSQIKRCEMCVFVSLRTLKCTSRPPLMCTKSTTPWSCLPSTMTPASWQLSTRSALLREARPEAHRLQTVNWDTEKMFCCFRRRAVDSSTTTLSPGWLSPPANLLSCWPDTVILYSRRGGQVFNVDSIFIFPLAD